MLRDCAHSIVTYACWDGTTYPCWIGEKGVETSVAAVVEVDVDAAVEGEHEVADGIRALDREGVVVEGVEEPGVFCLDEVAGFLVCPELLAVSPCPPLSIPPLSIHRRTLYS